MSGQPHKPLAVLADQRFLLDLPSIAPGHHLAKATLGRCEGALAGAIGAHGAGGGIADQHNGEVAQPIVDHPSPFEC